MAASTTKMIGIALAAEFTLAKVTECSWDL
jgi:hypothetical protein